MTHSSLLTKRFSAKSSIVTATLTVALLFLLQAQLASAETSGIKLPFSNYDELTSEVQKLRQHGQDLAANGQLYEAYVAYHAARNLIVNNPVLSNLPQHFTPLHMEITLRLFFTKLEYGDLNSIRDELREINSFLLTNEVKDSSIESLKVICLGANLTYATALSEANHPLPSSHEMAEASLRLVLNQMPQSQPYFKSAEEYHLLEGEARYQLSALLEAKSDNDFFRNAAAENARLGMLAYEKAKQTADFCEGYAASYAYLAISYYTGLSFVGQSSATISGLETIAASDTLTSASCTYARAFLLAGLGNFQLDVGSLDDVIDTTQQAYDLVKDHTDEDHILLLNARLLETLCYALHFKNDQEELSAKLSELSDYLSELTSGAVLNEEYYLLKGSLARLGQYSLSSLSARKEHLNKAIEEAKIFIAIRADVSSELNFLLSELYLDLASIPEVDFATALNALRNADVLLASLLPEMDTYPAALELSNRRDLLWANLLNPIDPSFSTAQASNVIENAARQQGPELIEFHLNQLNAYHLLGNVDQVEIKKDLLRKRGVAEKHLQKFF